MSPITSLLAFAGVALILLSTLQGMRILKGGTFSSNFAKLFGLIVIAALGSALAASGDISAEARAAIYTLLGTLAGYLAGAKPSTRTTRSGRPGADGQDDSASTENVL